MDELNLTYNAVKMELTIYPIDSSRLHNITEVVRCKDCKYMEKARWHDGYRCGNPCDGMASGVELRDNDFCSYGERKDNDCN